MLHIPRGCRAEPDTQGLSVPIGDFGAPLKEALSLLGCPAIGNGPACPNSRAVAARCPCTHIPVPEPCAILVPSPCNPWPIPMPSVFHSHAILMPPLCRPHSGIQLNHPNPSRSLDPSQSSPLALWDRHQGLGKDKDMGFQPSSSPHWHLRCEKGHGSLSFSRDLNVPMSSFCSTPLCIQKGLIQIRMDVGRTVPMSFCQDPQRQSPRNLSRGVSQPCSITSSHPIQSPSPPAWHHIRPEQPQLSLWGSYLPDSVLKQTHGCSSCCASTPLLHKG